MPAPPTPMKFLPELFPSDLDVPPANEILLPQGLIGFVGGWRRARRAPRPSSKATAVDDQGARVSVR